MNQVVLQLLISLAATLGINAIPAGIVVLQGNPAQTAMVLYFLENLVSVLLAAARVRILAPADDQAYAVLGQDTVKTTVNGAVASERQLVRNRRRLITDYLLMSFGLSAGVGVFILFLVFFVGHADISGSVIATGMAGIVALQLFYFLADLVLLGPMTPPQAERVLQQSMGRVALLFFAVFIGIFVALVNINWFVIPFIVLRTVTDLAISVQGFSARVKTAASTAQSSI